MSESRPEILALIPARGGSKGVPRKNVLPIAGRPLIAYSIDHGRHSRHITRVIVSTEDDEILAAALAAGAEAPFRRPADLAGDLSPDIDVFAHALTWLRDHEGYRPELVVHLRPTGPLRCVDRIDAAIELLLAHPEADALRSVSWPPVTPFKMWRIDESGYLRPLLTVPGLRDAHSQPRQILPETFWQNGYVDIVRPSTVLEKHSMTGDCVVPFRVMEPILDLDHVDDIPILEAALLRIARGESPFAGTGRRVDRYPA